MRLLIVSDSFLPRWDGVSRFLSLIIPALSEEFQVTVIAPRYKGTTPSYKNVDLELVPTYEFKVGDYPPPKPAFKKVKQLVNKSDIIWCQTLGLLGGHAIKYAKKKGKKVVAYTHSVEWELFPKGFSRSSFIERTSKKFIRDYVRNRYNRCDLLMVPSLEFKRVLKSKGITTRMKVVPMGIDTRSFKPAKSRRNAKRNVGIDPNKTIIGYVGRIGKEKDLPTLHEAFMILKKKFPEIILMIVGEGSRKEEQRLYGEDIMKLGRIDNVIPYLQAMDVYVLPSLTETSSLSTMEAMACGLPVVTTKAGSLAKYIKSGVNGYHFPMQDAEALYRILASLIDNPKHAKEVGKAARKKIMQSFKWKDTEKKIIGIIKGLS